mgnify:FL=1
MYNKSRIAILMATYNGECYLNYQIESIMGQSFEDWTLYISCLLYTSDAADE